MSKISAIENHIVDLLGKQDKTAIKLIYENYGKILFGTILKIVGEGDIAEDVLQEVLVKIWKNGKQYDQQKGRLFTWLINIARNAAIDKTRSIQFKQSVNIRQEGNTVSNKNEEATYALEVDAIGLEKWVDQLDPKQREVIEIIYFKGYSHREAAKVLELPLGTLKTRVRTALNELRKLVKD